MPEPSPRSYRTIALALLASVLMLAVMAVLILAGTIPVADQTGPMIAIALGFVAFTDLMVAIWFFRKGQSS